MTDAPDADDETTAVAVTDDATPDAGAGMGRPAVEPYGGDVGRRWRAFLREYRRPTQWVLLVAGVLSLLLPGQAPTGALLVALSVLNAALGLHRGGEAARPEGTGSPSATSPADEADRLLVRVLLFALAAFVVAFGVGLARSLNDRALTLIAVALAVAAIPTSLPLARVVMRRRGAGTASPEVGAVGGPSSPDAGVTLAIRFGLACLIGFIVTSMGASVLGIFAGIPFVPLGTLWISFTVDLFGAIGLGRRLPRAGSADPASPPGRLAILPGTLAAWLAVCGLVMAVGTLGVSVYALSTWDEPVAQTMGFATFSLFHLWLALEMADPRRSAFSRAVRANRTLLKVTAASLITIALAVSFAPLGQLLHTSGLALDQWLLCLAVSLTIVVVAEARKRLRLVAADELADRDAGDAEAAA